jgi:asparagine synthase (glutamine-hydrolysing)
MTRTGNITLGNTRLAIQDPSPAGNQPFVSRDGRYLCVFNGEIYNYRRLVERYQISVRTGCDGEVIPELWAKLGSAALTELRGMFAIALVDTLSGRLYLARDPFGIKPLYWRAMPDGRFAFASEVRALMQVGRGVHIDSMAVGRYLSFGAMAADQSPFLEIRALPPDNVAEVSKGNDVELRPITARAPLESSSPRADLGAALADSIELHLGADVPTALLLSAGVDSAAVAAIARRLGRDLHCLTVATEGSADESSEAMETARHYGHRHQRIPAALDAGNVDGFFAAMQRPSIDGLNTFVVCRAVREAGFKVAVSGLGGDEVVGGYPHFNALRYLPALRLMDQVPGSIAGALAQRVMQRRVAGRQKVKRLLAKGGPRHGRDLSMLQREVLPASLVSALTGISDVPAADSTFAFSPIRPGPFQDMVGAELSVYLQPMLLADSDAFSMSSSIELRVPFVDPLTFSAALRLNARGRVAPGKSIIGTALGDPYLSDLATRPKRGFSVPMLDWLSGPLAPVLAAANEPDAAIWSILDRTSATRYGLVPLKLRERWADVWVLSALNAWLESVSHVKCDENL